jgi:hypothetical protein
MHYKLIELSSSDIASLYFIFFNWLIIVEMGRKDNCQSREGIFQADPMVKSSSFFYFGKVSRK